LSTTSISRSTSASVISAVRDQHNAASSVSLIGVGIARNSDGYAAAARAIPPRLRRSLWRWFLLRSYPNLG
jgi:hypothetical protein